MLDFYKLREQRFLEEMDGTDKETPKLGDSRWGLVSIFYVLGPVLSLFYVLSYLFLMTVLEVRDDSHPQFTDEETGDPWVAQWFGACLWLRARSWRPGIESHVGLPV